MAKGEKILERMRNNPRDWRISEIEALCKDFGLLRKTFPWLTLQSVASRAAGNINHFERSSGQTCLHSQVGCFHRCGDRSKPVKPQDYAVEIQPLSQEDGGGFVALVP
jgi:hypothetical protein